MGDPLVKVGNQVMTLSQYQAMVNQAVSTYTQQMTVAIENLSSLQDQMYVHGGDVAGALYQLQSDMAGLSGAIGTDDNGNKFRNAWFAKGGPWDQLQQGFNGLSTALYSIGDSLGNAADTCFQAEQQTLTGFNNMNIGFHFNATDPRLPPPGSTPPRGRNRAF
jgi:hypothetical protein